MTLGVETDVSGAHQQPDRFIEAGGTLVDIADVQGVGRSEEGIGRWFACRPADLTEPVVLATEDALAPFAVRIYEQHLPPARTLELIAASDAG